MGFVIAKTDIIIFPYYQLYRFTLREMSRRMQEVREKLKAYRAKNVSDISM